MEARYPWLLAVVDWPRYRLSFGRCWAQGCGRRPIILHTPRQLRRCERTPMAVALTARGWLRAHGLDPEAVDGWCRANGIQPDSILQPVVPVSHTRSA